MKNDKLRKTGYTPIKKIASIISLLSNSSKQYTFASLSKELNASVNWTKNAIKTIAESQNTYEFYIDGTPISNTALNEKRIDDKTITLRSNLASHILISEDDLKKYNHFLKAYHRNASFQCVFKENYAIAEAPSVYAYENYYEFQEAFLKKKDCRHKKTGALVHPIALFHDTLTFKVYCVTLRDGSITFYPIEELTILRDAIDIYTIFEEKDILTTLNLIKYVWSPEKPISLMDKPSHYRILIENQPNVLEKIYHDVSNIKAAHKTLSDGRHILEFSAISCEKLFSWLLSYGSSITVLEPQDIRKRVIQEYENLLRWNSYF